jgi:hypothetical protein
LLLIWKVTKVESLAKYRSRKAENLQDVFFKSKRILKFKIFSCAAMLQVHVFKTKRKTGPTTDRKIAGIV